MTHRNAHTLRSQPAFSGRRVSQAVNLSQLVQPSVSVALSHEKTPCVTTGGLIENGAGEETRTLDIFLGKEVLYQLSYTRKLSGKK